MNARIRPLAALATILLLPAGLAGQDAAGRIIGQVVDASTGLAVSGARVTVAGTTLVVTTRIDGRFALPGVGAGQATLRVSMIGYAPKTVTEIVVRSGEATEQNVSLIPQAVQLEEVTVTAATEQGSARAVLDDQRHSIAIVNAISSEQISRSPDGDAAAALQRVSGATVQDGKYLNFRGLGDRYTQASLNGARIPSPEPERKVVPLDLFPSSLLSDITTSKTFTPDQAGDFSGGAVNIRTREFFGAKYLSFSVSTGFNDAVVGTRSGFAPSTSWDWLAFGAAPRSLPTAVATADFSQHLPASEANGLINSLRNVWTPRPRRGSPNGSFGAALGGTLPGVGAGLSYLISGSYSYSQEIRADEHRAIAQPPGTEGGSVTELDRYDGSTGRASALWGGIANFSTALGASTKISLNTTYTRTMDNEGRRESGTSENLALPLVIQRLRYVERTVYSSQLGVERQLGRRHLVFAGLNVAGVARKEPDRSEMVYETSTGMPTWLGFSNQAAVRTFGDLSERSIEGTASWRVSLGAGARARFFQVGGMFRSTNRDAVNRSYSISLVRPLNEADRGLAPEEIFDGRFTQGSADQLRISPLAAGGSYIASDRLAAGYGMFTLELSPAMEVVTGARIERSAVEVSSLSTAGEPSLATPSYTDVLPSLAVNFRIGTDQNLRLSATQTLSRPEYRELSPILFREVIGGDNIKGNADLKRALIRNYDVRWEWYPRSGEVLSLAVFAKQFTNPIERVYQGTSGERIITYVNAEGGDNLGLELDARKALFDGFSLFANATVMKSEIRIDPNAGSVTNSDRKMVGQAPYVFNGGLTWKHPSANASATVLVNRVGERISEAGELPLPDVVEQPRTMLDVSLHLPLFGSLGAKVDVRNLLDSPYRRMQGSVVRESYRAGRVFSIGFNWKQ